MHGKLCARSGRENGYMSPSEQGAMKLGLVRRAQSDGFVATGK